MEIPESLRKIFESFTKKKETISMESITKLPYMQLRKQLKAEIIKLTEDYIKSGTGYIGGTDYMNIRSKHVAYSMFKGRTFEQVEKSWKHPESWINKSVQKRSADLLASYQARVDREASDEALRLNP